MKWRPKTDLTVRRREKAPLYEPSTCPAFTVVSEAAWSINWDIFLRDALKLPINKQDRPFTNMNHCANTTGTHFEAHKLSWRDHIFLLSFPADPLVTFNVPTFWPFDLFCWLMDPRKLHLNFRDQRANTIVFDLKQTSGGGEQPFKSILGGRGAEEHIFCSGCYLYIRCQGDWPICINDATRCPLAELLPGDSELSPYVSVSLGVITKDKLELWWQLDLQKSIDLIDDSLIFLSYFFGGAWCVHSPPVVHKTPVWVRNQQVNAIAN